MDDLRSVLREDELLQLRCHVEQMRAAVTAHPCPPAELDCARVSAVWAVTGSSSLWEGAALEVAVEVLAALTVDARALGAPEAVTGPVAALLAMVRERVAALA